MQKISNKKAHAIIAYFGYIILCSCCFSYFFFVALKFRRLGNVFSFLSIICCLMLIIANNMWKTLAFEINISFLEEAVNNQPCSITHTKFRNKKKSQKSTKKIIR